MIHASVPDTNQPHTIREVRSRSTLGRAALTTGVPKARASVRYGNLKAHRVLLSWVAEIRAMDGTWLGIPFIGSLEGGSGALSHGPPPDPKEPCLG